MTPLALGARTCGSLACIDTTCEVTTAMDQELIAYLDERFRESARHAESLHQENMQQITGLHLETNQRFEKMEERQDRTETEIRRAQVMVEGLRGEIQLVAEGVSGLGEKQRSFRREVAQKFRQRHRKPL